MRGHERTVALLIVRNVNVDMLSFPTLKQAGRTAADMASQNGHWGMAAYLAELTVMQHMDKHDQQFAHDVLSGTYLAQYIKDKLDLRELLDEYNRCPYLN
jgi:hypothetical protein